MQTELMKAAQQVINSWEKGNLAGAVNRLREVLEDMGEASPDLFRACETALAYIHFVNFGKPADDTAHWDGLLKTLNTAIQKAQGAQTK